MKKYFAQIFNKLGMSAHTGTAFVNTEWHLATSRQPRPNVAKYVHVIYWSSARVSAQSKSGIKRKLKSFTQSRFYGFTMFNVFKET